MGQNKRWKLGPIQMAASPTNLLNPGTVTGGINSTDTHYNSIRIYLKRIRIINTDSADHVVSLWIGATGASAAGTEFLVSQTAVPANDGIEFPCERMLDKDDFLVGEGTTDLTIEGDLEIGIA